ncbi:MAG: M23 family metallopeptidase [Actinomycetota bacterium]|nr:M23 family metallopeptidase [Actinomycetota bacterium]
MTSEHPVHPASGQDQFPSRLTRRRLLAGGLAVGVVALAPACEPPPTAAYPARPEPANPCNFGYDWPRPPLEVHRRPMMFPVLDSPTLGRATWTDTYMAPRGSGSCRYHEGQDLIAPKMLKLLACVDGTVVDLRHATSGNSLTLKDDDGYYYGYLHINNDRPGTDDGSNLFANAFAPGLATGQQVRQGQLVGYVGDSGNAETAGSHCHFEIRVPNATMWKAAAVNPKFSLESAVPAALRST